MANAPVSRHTGLFVFVVLSITAAGYFAGMQSPVRPAAPQSDTPDADEPHTDGSTHASVIRATRYADMPVATHTRTRTWATRLTALQETAMPSTSITFRPGDKQAALKARDRNRAFNGAPPTIPHPVDQRSDRACTACHVKGAKTASLRIPRMSHSFLANCTQCHVENNPRHMTASLFRENSFKGLPAPTAGPRAFPGAPPVIPHSTWMRNDCMSCHGPTGLYGIRTTHPWRQNCQQCHAPSSKLNQSPLAPHAEFLPPPKVESKQTPRKNGSTP